MAANEEDPPAVAAVVLVVVDKDEPNTEDDKDFLRAVVSSTDKPNPASSSSLLLLSSLCTSRYLYLTGCLGTSCRTPAIGTSPCGGGCDVFLLVNVRFELSKKLSSSVSSESDAAAARALLLIAPNGRDRRDHGEAGEAVPAAGFLLCFGMINKEKRGDYRE